MRSSVATDNKIGFVQKQNDICEIYRQPVTRALIHWMYRVDIVLSNSR